MKNTNTIQTIIRCAIASAFLTFGLTALAERFDAVSNIDSIIQVEDGTISNQTLPCVHGEK